MMTKLFTCEVFHLEHSASESSNQSHCRSRNVIKRLAYSIRGGNLLAKQEYEKPSKNQACITKDVARVFGDSTQCSMNILQKSGTLSTLRHQKKQASKQFCGDVTLATPLAITLPTSPTYTYFDNDFEASSEDDIMDQSCYVISKNFQHHLGFVLHS